MMIVSGGGGGRTASCLQLAALVCAIGHLAGGAQAARRFNLFEPLFADDDPAADAHTVRAVSASGSTADSRQQQQGAGVAATSNKKILEIKNTNVQQQPRRLPSAIADQQDGPSLGATVAASVKPAPQQRKIESSIAGWSTLGPSAGQGANRGQRLTAAAASADAPAKLPAQKRQAEKPQHWSALASYYETLRKASGQQQQQQFEAPPVFLRLQPSANQQQADLSLYEQRMIDELLASRQRNPPPIYKGASSGAPSLDSSQQQQQQQQEQRPQEPLQFLQQAVPAPAAKSDGWQFALAGLGQQQEARNNYPAEQQQQQQLLQLAAARRQQEQLLQRQRDQQLQDWLEGSKVSVYLPERVASAGPLAAKTSASAGAEQQRPIQVQFPLGLLDSGSSAGGAPLQPYLYAQGRQPANLNDGPIGPIGPVAPISPATRASWQSLAESMFQQLQENRVRHQLDAFGSALDRRRFREQVRQENYCGPRNYIVGADAEAELARGLGSARLRELMARAVAPANYPSHMGLYNGSEPADSAYLCAATWVHERFAVTLASCLPRPLAGGRPLQLTLRAGEWWALGARAQPQSQSISNDSSSSARPSSFTRRVQEVHLFPRYQPNSTDYDLALLEWAGPAGESRGPGEWADYLQNFSLISPACPLQARDLLPGSARCWAPVRHVALSEYFDAEGEGETKLARQLSVQEVELRLLNDDLDCKRETQLEHFNYENPPYICAADVRRAPWRAKLNQTDNFGSGIYCNHNGRLSLVAMLNPAHLASASQFGYTDLTYYWHWMQGVISARS